METIDIIVAAVCFLFFILGLFKGIIKIIFAISGFLVALFLGYFLYPAVSIILSQNITFFMNNPIISSVASFIIIFIVVNLLFLLVSFLLTSVLRALKLGWIDKLIGGVCSLFVAILIWSLAFNVVVVIPIAPDKRASLENSLSYRFIKPIFVVFKNIGSSSRERMQPPSDVQENEI